MNTIKDFIFIDGQHLNLTRSQVRSVFNSFEGIIQEESSCDDAMDVYDELANKGNYERIKSLSLRETVKALEVVDCVRKRLRRRKNLLEPKEPRTRVGENVEDKLSLRFDVLKRDNFTCQYCGRNTREHGVILHLDHVLPRSKGGEDAFDNLITACAECNLGKNTKCYETKDVFIE